MGNIFYFILTCPHENLANIIKAFNSTSRYLDDLINIQFEKMVDKVYPKELNLIKYN